MVVESASLRLATPKEVSHAKGGYLWKTLTFPWNLVNKVWGLWEIYRKGADTLKWQTPLPLAAAHSFSRWMGWAPERSFMEDLPSLLGNFHIVKTEEVVFRTFFKEHRNSGLFEYSRSFRKMLEFIQTAFPETEFTEEDCILTCTAENTKLYRRIIMEALRGEGIKAVIQQEIKSTLASWVEKCEDGAYMNATEECQLYASRVITRLLLGMEAGGEELAKAVNFINYYIVGVFTRTATEKDKEQFLEALKQFSGSVNEVLNSGKEIPLFEGKELTIAQKKAMIFVIFFAGQETVASLLTYILWDLGKKPEQQLKLTSDKVHNLFVHAIHDFPPAHGVSRILKNDVCLEFKMKGEKKVRKLIMYKGEWLAVQMIKHAEKVELPEESEEKLKYSAWMPFGNGPHRCPGEALAVREIKEMVEEIVSGYEVKVQDTKDVSMVGLVTLKLSEDIYVNITPN